MRTKSQGPRLTSIVQFEKQQTTIFTLTPRRCLPYIHLHSISYKQIIPQRAKPSDSFGSSYSRTSEKLPSVTFYISTAPAEFCDLEIHNLNFPEHRDISHWELPENLAYLRPAMSLLGLPNELLIIISEHLKEPEISSLSRTNCRLYTLLTPILNKCATRICRKVFRRTDLTIRCTLHWAAWKGHERLFKLLLDEGININCPIDNHHGNSHETALHFAAFQGSEAIVKLLLDKGADIDQPDENGTTALHLAALRGHESVVRLLLENGADITVKDKAGLSVISRALKSYYHYQAQRNPKVFQLLLDYKADINVKDHEGATALHHAVKLGDIKILGTLLDLGASPYIKSKDGETALDWALIQTFPLPDSRDTPQALGRRYQIVKFLQKRKLIRCLGGKYYDEQRPSGRREYWKLACGSGFQNQVVSVVKTLTSIECPTSTLGRYYRQKKINSGRLQRESTYNAYIL